MVRVRYKNGFETAYKPEIAAVLIKRGQVVAIEDKPAPKLVDREALIKKALKLKLADRAELDILTDADLEAFVAEAK